VQPVFFIFFNRQHFCFRSAQGRFSAVSGSLFLLVSCEIPDFIRDRNSLLLRLPCGVLKTIIMATTSDISRGMILKLDGSLYSVVEFGENKTARAAAKVWAKLKGVDNNRSIEKTWNSGENIFPVRVEKKAFQFLYKDDTGYNLMNNETFEQIALPAHMIDAPQFLMDGSEVFVFINTETEQPIGAELPEKIVVKITYCEPGLRGDTATRALKAATVETGATVMVPLFVDQGESIRVNTKTGDYVERVKD
jgi:elongation factor P